MDVTYAVNPILVKAARRKDGIRGRDITIRAADLEGNLASYLVKTAGGDRPEGLITRCSLRRSVSR